MQSMGISNSPAASSSSSTVNTVLTVDEAYVDMITYTRQFLSELQNDEDFQNRIQAIARYANPIFTVLAHSEATDSRIKKVIHKEQRALDASALKNINFKLDQLFQGLITCFNQLRDPDEIQSFRKFMLNMQGNFGNEIEASLKAKNALLQQYRNEYAKTSPVKIHTEWPQLNKESGSTDYLITIGDRTWTLPGAVNCYLDADWNPPELFLRDLCCAEAVDIGVKGWMGSGSFMKMGALQSDLEVIQANGNSLPYKKILNLDETIAEETDLPLGDCHDNSVFNEISKDIKILYKNTCIYIDELPTFISAEVSVSPEIYELLMTRIQENPREVLAEYKAWAKKSAPAISDYLLIFYDKANSDRAFRIKSNSKENSCRVLTYIKHAIFQIGFHFLLHDGSGNKMIVDAHGQQDAIQHLIGTPTQIGPMILDGKDVTNFIRNRLNFLFEQAERESTTIKFEDQCPEGVQPPNQTLLNNCYDMSRTELFENAKTACESLSRQLPGVKVSLVKRQPVDHSLYFEVSHQEYNQLMDRLSGFGDGYGRSSSQIEVYEFKDVVHIIPNPFYLVYAQSDSIINGVKIRCLSDIEDFSGFEFTVVSPFEKVAPIVIETESLHQVNEIVSFLLKNKIVDPYHLHVEGSKIYLSGRVNLSSLQMSQAKRLRLNAPEGASTSSKPVHVEPLPLTKAERFEQVKKAFQDLLPKSYRDKIVAEESSDGQAVNLSFNMEFNFFAKELINTAMFILSRTALSGCRLIEQQGKASVLQLSYSGGLLERLESLPKIRQRLKQYFAEALSQNRDDSSRSQALISFSNDCRKITIGHYGLSLTSNDPKNHFVQLGGEKSLIAAAKAGNVDDVVTAVRWGVDPNRLLANIFYEKNIKDPYPILEGLIVHGGLNPNFSVKKRGGHTQLLLTLLVTKGSVFFDNRVKAVELLLKHGASLFPVGKIESPLYWAFDFFTKYEESQVQSILLMLEHLQKNRVEGDACAELLQKAFGHAASGYGEYPDERILQKMQEMGVDISISHITNLFSYIARTDTSYKKTSESFNQYVMSLARNNGVNEEELEKLYLESQKRNKGWD